MDIHPTRINREPSVSTALTTTYEAQSLAKRLEDMRAKAAGSIELARQQIARETRISAGTLENLRRGRIKQVAAWVRDSLQAAVIRQLENEVRALEHEIHILRQQGAHPASPQVSEAETYLARARAALGFDAPRSSNGGE